MALRLLQQRLQAIPRTMQSPDSSPQAILRPLQLPDSSLQAIPRPVQLPSNSSLPVILQTVPKPDSFHQVLLKQLQRRLVCSDCHHRQA